MKTVYWAIPNLNNFSPISKALYFAPELLTNQNTFTDMKLGDKHNNFKLCPAYNDTLKNTFKLKFPLDFDLKFDSNGVGSSKYDMDFFDYFVNIRSFEDRYFGLKVSYIFFSEDDLEMSLMPPYLEDNDFINTVTSFPGTFNIGKWLRPTDYACRLKAGQNKIDGKRGDAFNYVKFHSDDEVRLIQFDYVDEIQNIQKDILRSKMILGSKSPKLDWFYTLLIKSKYKKKILDLIKNNILEEQ
jgi:hypothetical protein